MSDLEPCPACHRHVRIDEPACPFCAAALPTAEPRTIGTRRMTRAAVFFAGAALATAAGCGGKQTKAADHEVVSNEVIDGGAEEASTPDAAAVPVVETPYEVDNTCCMPYGAPPVRQRLV